MPELPEVETVAQGLNASLAGQKVVAVTLNRSDLRFPFPQGLTSRLEGASLLCVRRRAKYLLFDLNTGETIIAHLGMSGTMRVLPLDDYAPQTHDHVLWEMESGLLFVFRDPRRFGMMDIIETQHIAEHALLKELAPEPLSADFTPKSLQASLERSACKVKVAIMDQKRVVGVGNIYASEALLLSGISPFMPAYQAAAKSNILHQSIVKVLEAAIRSGGSTLRDYVRSDGDWGYFQHEFNVYDRNELPCNRCGNAIQMKKQSGRSTYFCVECQSVE